MYIATIKAEIVPDIAYGYVVRYTSVYREGYNFHTWTEIGGLYDTIEEAEAEMRYRMG